MPASQRILVRGVNWLGDAVMTTPALQRLREAHPDSQVTLLTSEKLKDLWAGHPAVTAVETFAKGESAWSIGRRLRAGRFDLGLVLPNSPRSALEVRLAGVPERVGYARPWRNWLLTRAIPPRPGSVAMRKRPVGEINRLIAGNGRGPGSAFPPEAHHIHEYLHLAAALGANPAPLAPRLAVSAEAVTQFAARFNLAPNPGGSPPLLGLNPAAEYGPAKRWPEERFIEAAIQIQRRSNCRWLVLGLDADRDLCGRITYAITRAAAGPPAISLAGATTLGELCAALKLCRLVLTNDSGPMHVAAAFGTPVIVPFGSTSPEMTGPGLPGDGRHACLRSGAPCSPCFLRECPIDFRCMTGISVDSVVQAAFRLVPDLGMAA
jgi:heptosyltransferase-2